MQYEIITGEAFCYLVHSETQAEESYRVDLVENECGCRDWVCRHRQHKEETGQVYRCKHIKQLREIALNDIIEHIKQRLTNQA